MKKEKKKKNKMLFIQLGMIVIPVFILMVIAASYATYKSTVDSYLDAKDSHMTYVLDEIYSNVMFTDNEFFEWKLERWEAEPSLMLEPITDEEEDMAWGYVDEIDNDDYWTPSWFERKPKIVQDYICKQTYDIIKANLMLDNDRSDYESTFMIDLRESHRGMVIVDNRKNGVNKKLGDYFNIKLSEHPAIMTMLETNGDDTEFEIAIDFPDTGSYYIGYKPVISNGNVVAAIAVVYRWSEFKETMMKAMMQAAEFGLGAMVVDMLLLYLMIYRKAIYPVRKIKKGVRDYIETKDSAKVISRMAKVKERNELGILAEDITDLAREIDHFTEENVRLAGERERVAAELDMAKNIQAGQLPSTFPAFPDRKEFDIYASMNPAKEVGGDFYDFFLIDDDHLALVIADVSGKGVPAALFMMMSKILINDYAMMGLSPHEVLERTNETICKNNKQKMFVTVWFGILEISTGKITAANAGHEYPIIRQPDGKYELFKDKHGFVIGGIKGKKYKEYEFTLQKGGTLFVYTDGVPEATDSALEMFGTERLIDTLNRHIEEPPDKLLESVHGEVNDFVGEAAQFDDLTMLGITIL